jgi:hypothetical protein
MIVKENVFPLANSLSLSLLLLDEPFSKRMEVWKFISK